MMLSRTSFILSRQSSIGHIRLAHAYILRKDPPYRSEHLQYILTVENIFGGVQLPWRYHKPSDVYDITRNRNTTTNDIFNNNNNNNNNNIIIVFKLLLLLILILLLRPKVNGVLNTTSL